MIGGNDVHDADDDDDAHDDYVAAMIMLFTAMTSTVRVMIMMLCFVSMAMEPSSDIGVYVHCFR